MKDFDRSIERLFRYVEMCAVTGLINLALRTVLSTGWALLLTLPWAALALLYLLWPSLQKHDQWFEKFDREGTLTVGLGFVLLGCTLWLMDRLLIAVHPQ